MSPGIFQAESILDADEDDQLAAAIQASLKESTKSEAKKKPVITVSDDSDDDEDYDYFESFSAEASNSSFPNVPPKVDNKTDTSKDLFEPDDEDDDKEENNEQSWEKYLGDKGDPHSSIMIRFPDGNRVTKDIPCTSQFMVSYFEILFAYL